jgi:FtsP/CotA-like multicopper oxidase with cupredoxin domain
MRSTTWTIVAIAALGLVLAVALGIFADTIARGTVALPSTNLTRTSTQLAPDQAATRLATRTTPKKAKKRPTPTGTTTATAPTTTAEAGDDHGGRSRGRGSDDSSGSSSHSGKGGDD